MKTWNKDAWNSLMYNTLKQKLPRDITCQKLNSQNSHDKLNEVKVMLNFIRLDCQYFIS